VLTHGYVVDADGKKMSKSLGNIVAPGEVIEQFGAEILRLWVSASDYRDDVRISDKFLKQLTDAYRRIRNTCRFMLGNLYDFAPSVDSVALDRMPPIDRFALHRLQELVAKCRKAYEDYEFHVIYHAVHNFCALDLSAFYLDVLKDRLYTSAAKSEARRSAQTVMSLILDRLVRIMAPILSFTAEEIWQYMPADTERLPSVHEALLPEVDSAMLDSDLAESWNRMLKVRGEVTRVIEAARAQKRIGHSLDASVAITAGDTLYRELLPFAEDLRSILIVSDAALRQGDPLEGSTAGEEIPELWIAVAPARGEKCQRCWVREDSVGEDEQHPDICTRCRSALAEIAPAGE
jgi:isoleucyl-tRNA synthetase